MEAGTLAKRFAGEVRILGSQGRWIEALVPARKAAECDPTSVQAALELGVLLTKLGRLQEAEQELRRGLSLDPDSAPLLFSLSQNLLAQGRYHEAWPFYRAGEQLPPRNRRIPRNLPFPRWNGEALEGKRLAIFPEEGLGEQIQFVRFLPSLLASAKQVILLVKPILARLYRGNFPDAEIVIADGRVEFAEPDYWTTLQDLPVVLDVGPNDIGSEPYLVSRLVGPCFDKGFKIGLKTKCDTAHALGGMGALPEDCLARLRADLPGQVISLEPEDGIAVDMADFAAVLDELDLVISVDSWIANLAGALGKPCLLLVPGFSLDWRWMTGRADFPWYPNHRIFRSEANGDWHATVTSAIAEAEQCAATGSAEPNALPEARNIATSLVRQAAAQRDQGHWPETLDLMKQAAEKVPDDGGVLNSLGLMLGNIGRLGEAESYLRRALALSPGHPGMESALGMNLLGQGRYGEAWPLYERRVDVPYFRIKFPTGMKAPRWRGEDLAGKTIGIMPEQGFGDSMQFARFLPQLRERGANVRLFAPPPLAELFRFSFPDVEVVAATGEVERGQLDYWTTLVDMAGPLGVTLETLSAAPYLRTDRNWPKLPAGFKIGFQPTGNKRYLNDVQRSLGQADLVRLRGALPGHVVDLDPKSSGAKDFADTAALIQQLDLVVSVDTAVAHLAGALGKPCLLLLPPTGTDWRWMRGRDDSPWYPRHQLFRGTIDGGWNEAIDRLVAEAEMRARASSAPVAAKGDAALAALMLQAKVLRDKTRFPEAIELMRRAMRRAPNSPAPPNILGTMLGDVGRLDEAEMLQRRAVALRPDYPAFRYDLGITLLAQGRYDEGWPLYQARSEIPSLKIAFPKGIAKPRWRGEELAGKRLTIMPEQGFGDAIQFARFLPRLRERDAQVRLYVQPALVALFRSSFPGIEILAAEGQVRLGNPDFWTTLIDMAGPLGVAPHSLPRPPYLRTDRTWPALGDGFKIGLQTRGNPQHANDAWRSLPARDAEALRAALSGQVIDLDPASSGARDFADTAALILQLDLIVSVDTSVAHLAGALGKPCLLLVPGIATDWRWMRDRADSPWYPRHKLYRSALDGNWKLALERLVADADALRIALGGTAA